MISLQVFQRKRALFNELITRVCDKTNKMCVKICLFANKTKIQFFFNHKTLNGNVILVNSQRFNLVTTTLLARMTLGLHFGRNSKHLYYQNQKSICIKLYGFLRIFKCILLSSKVKYYYKEIIIITTSSSTTCFVKLCLHHH